MRWPIRNQILLPLVTIQVAVVVGVSWLAAWSSLRRVDREVQQRFEELTETIEQSSFPLTSAVLKQLRGLSGAEFVVQNARGTVEETTLSPEKTAAWVAAYPQGLPESSGEPVQATLSIGDYLAVPVTARLQSEPQLVAVLYPRSLIQSARLDAIQGPIFLGFLSLVLTTFAVVLVAQHIGRRIQGIEAHVARVARGDFSPIPLSDHQDELRDLSASVNRMGEQLDEFTQHIRETERSQLIKQLAGGIAHQLRNSLTGARLALQVHRRRCDRPEDESLSIALRQLALTEQQIRGLVALIRDQDRPRIPMRVKLLAEEVAALIQPMCEHRQIHFSLNGETGDAEVADADQIRAALLNLCMNAIEATSAGGHVQVDLSMTDDELTIDVQDDGPGVPPEFQDSIFEPFQTTKPDGMGLGLALVHQTARDQQGSIVYSREENRTRFRLTCRCLPQSPDAQC